MAMTLEAVMKLNTAGFLGPLTALTRAMGPFMAAIGVGGGIAGAVAGLKKGMDLGGLMSDLTARTGIATKDLTILRQAFTDTGVGAENGTMAITYMQRALSGLDTGEGEKALRRLGLSMEELRGKNTVQQLEAISQKFQGIADPAQRTALAMQIFGRSGAAMNQFMGDPKAIETARKSLGSLPDILQRSAPLLDSISDSFGRIPMKLQGAFSGLVAGLSPTLKAIADWIDSIDFAKIGERIGTFISVIIEAVKSGQLGELIGAAVSTGIMSALRALPAMLLTMLQTIWGMIKEMFGFAVGAAEGLFGPENRLQQIWDELSAKVEAERTALEKAAAPASTGLGSTTVAQSLAKGIDLKISSDKLARIGGFVGLGGGPALDAARRTADNTARMADGMERLIDSVDGLDMQPVWS